MRVEDLLEELKEQYPDTIVGISGEKELIERQTQQEMIAHIELIITPPPKRKK